jgi:hypothetical protein
MFTLSESHPGKRRKLSLESAGAIRRSTQRKPALRLLLINATEIAV